MNKIQKLFISNQNFSNSTTRLRNLKNKKKPYNLNSKLYRHSLSNSTEAKRYNKISLTI